MVVRKREVLWGFWQTEIAKQPFGVVESPEGRGELWGMEKGREEKRLGRRGKGVNGKVMEKGRGEDRQADCKY